MACAGESDSRRRNDEHEGTEAVPTTIRLLVGRWVVAPTSNVSVAMPAVEAAGRYFGTETLRSLWPFPQSTEPPDRAKEIVSSVANRFILVGVTRRS